MYFIIDRVIPGYGPRIFLNGDHIARFEPDGTATKLETAHQRLKTLCCWGGHDKVWESPKGDFWGYEFPSNMERFDLAKAIVECLLGEPLPGLPE